MMILWLKAFHVFFMVAWFAGIFYLPRLFVYHAKNQASGSNSNETSETFKVMERRLLYFVTPFAILTILLGIGLIHMYGGAWFKQAGWMHAKMTLVLALVAYHAYCFKILNDFKHDKNKRSARFYRIFNELPVLVLLAIIILAIVKPF